MFEELESISHPLPPQPCVLKPIKKELSSRCHLVRRLLFTALDCIPVDSKLKQEMLGGGARNLVLKESILRNFYNHLCMCVCVCACARSVKSCSRAIQHQWGCHTNLLGTVLVNLIPATKHRQLNCYQNLNFPKFLILLCLMCRALHNWPKKPYPS